MKINYYLYLLRLILLFTSASMYVDLVNNTFSYNSMDSEKFQLMDDIKDMFNFLMKKKTKKVTEIA